MAAQRQYWLFKSEPDVFSYDDLCREPKRTALWDGVRNYQARNMLRDDVKVGDGILFYHSRVAPMAVVGVAEVVRAGYPDPTQFDPKAKYYDPKAKPETPRWYVVDIKAKQAFVAPVTLAELREVPSLEDMALLRKGSRLSIQPVTAAQWRVVLKMGGVADG